MPLYPGQKAIHDVVCSEYVGTRTVELLFLAKLQHVDCSNDRMVHQHCHQINAIYNSESRKII